MMQKKQVEYLHTVSVIFLKFLFKIYINKYDIPTSLIASETILHISTNTLRIWDVL